MHRGVIEHLYGEGGVSELVCDRKTHTFDFDLKKIDRQKPNILYFNFCLGLKQYTIFSAK